MRQDDCYASRHAVRLEGSQRSFRPCLAKSVRQWQPRTRFLQSRSLTGMGLVINAGTKLGYRLPGMRMYLPAFRVAGPLAVMRGKATGGPCRHPVR
jgi:hypothetical protein